MEAVKKLEKSIEKVCKDLPHLPESSREGLANIWPWLALVGGIVQLLAAWSLHRLANWADRLNDTTNLLTNYYSADVGPSSFDKTIIYLGVATLAVEAFLLLTAYPKLKNRQRAGWDLLFLAALVNVAYSLIQLFTYDRGVYNFVFGLIGSAIGFYLLFEVKGKFNIKTNSSNK